MGYTIYEFHIAIRPLHSGSTKLTWAFILKRLGGGETFRHSKEVEWWSLVESKRTFKGWESGWYQSWRRGLRDASPSRERGDGGPSLLIQWFPWEIEKLDHFRLFPDGARPICLTSFTLFSLSVAAMVFLSPHIRLMAHWFIPPNLTLSPSLLPTSLEQHFTALFCIGITEFCGKITNRISDHTKRIYTHFFERNSRNEHGFKYLQLNTWSRIYSGKLVGKFCMIYGTRNITDLTPMHIHSAYVLTTPLMIKLFLYM